MKADTIMRGPCGAFHNSKYTKYANTGKRIRGSTEIIGLINRGDKILGAVIFCHKL